MTYKSSFKSTAIKSLLAASLVLPLFPFATPAAAAEGLSVWLDGKAISYQQAPILINGATFVPLRETLEALGMTVEWDASTGSMTLTKGALTFEYNPKHKFAGVQDPVIQNGRYMIHIRALDRLIGAELQWNREQQAIHLSTLKTDLIEAIVSKNIPKAKQALANGVNPNSTYYYPHYFKEVSMLHLATDSFDHTLMKAMLEAGADPNLDDSLDRAVQMGRTGMVKLLLEHGAVPTTEHLTTNTEIMKLLLQQADLFPASKLEEMLLEAFQLENTELATLLMDSGVKLKVSGNASENQRGIEMLFDAASKNKPNFIKLLADHGVDVNHQKQGQTALMSAASQGNVSAVKALLAAGADPHLQNEKGATAWMIAEALGNSETAEALLAGGAKVTDVPTDFIKKWYDLHADKFGGELDNAFREMFGVEFNKLSPLTQAAVFGNTGEVKRLLETGTHTMADEYGLLLLIIFHTETMKTLLAEPNLLDENVVVSLFGTAVIGENDDLVNAIPETISEQGKRTIQSLLLQHAVERNNTARIESLLKQGVKQTFYFGDDISSPTESSPGLFQALYHVVHSGSPEAVRILLAHMDTMSAPERDDIITNGLASAASLENMECFDLIMKAKPSQASLDQALFSAADSGNVEASKALLEAGAKPTFKNHQGLTALQVAAQRGNSELLALFQSTTP